MRISTREAAAYAARREPFRSHGSLYATREPIGYTVYSYGPHWPLYVYDASCDCWFGNKEKRSATTSHHARAAMPRGVSITWLSLAEIEVVNRAGFAALVARRVSK